jgi:DNA mismatch endonuclease (patch repair protein)
MTDVVDSHARSRIMSSIRSRGNKSTELVMAAMLRKRRLVGWRRHYYVLGNPDFAWPKIQLAVFVDGCFWHGCPFCRRPPKSNVAFWSNKVCRNSARDRKVSRTLRVQGWSVIRVRECRLQAAGTIARIERLYRIRTRKLLVGAPQPLDR